jgi:hypothetical protein
MDNMEMKNCIHCGESFEVDHLNETRDGLVCDDCLSDDYGYCEHCNQYVPFDELSYVDQGTRDEEIWCDDCRTDDAVQCLSCGDWFTEDHAYQDDYGNVVCHSCWDSGDYMACDDCGRIFNSCYGDYYYDEDTGNTYCADCAPDHRRKKAIHNYGYKPDPEFAYRGKENQLTTLTFGIELEVDDGEEDAEDTAREVVDNAEGRIYCKHDSSLDSGFEIVSHPSSLNYHLYHFRWANIMRICSKAGFKSHDTDTCGLHIHVGIQQFGDDTRTVKGNLVLLADHFSGQLTKFSRRTADRLQRWAKFPGLSFTNWGTGELLSDEDLTDRAIGTRDNGRYQAVNLTNSSTVEFRIFRGTLKRDTLAASLELVNNLTKYAMTHTPRECVTATFDEIIKVDPKKELVNYCIKRRLISTEIKSN